MTKDAERFDELRWLLEITYGLAPPLEPFALTQAGVNNQVLGIRSSAGEFILKYYTSYDCVASIEYEHRLLCWLDAAGLSFRIPLPIPAVDGSKLLAGPDGPVSLMPRFKGTLPEFRVRNGRRNPHAVAQARLLGAALGELQGALQHHPKIDRPGNALFKDLFAFPPASRDPFALTLEQLHLPDTAHAVRLLEWWTREAQELEAFVRGDYSRLPQQLCHNDVSPANVLIDGERVSAIIDFEFASVTPRALDVANGLRMTMQVWENPDPWAVGQAFCDGYARWSRLTEAEVLALPQLIRLRQAVSFLWRLGRSAPEGSAERTVRRFAMKQRTRQWLDRHEQQLVDMVGRCLC